MAKVKLTSKKKFTYGTRKLVEGDEFEADSVEDANLLKNLDHAVDLIKKQTYQTRVMEPASLQAAPVFQGPPVFSQQAKSKHK